MSLRNGRGDTSSRQGDSEVRVGVDEERGVIDKGGQGGDHCRQEQRWDIYCLESLSRGVRKSRTMSTKVQQASNG